jgi:hypothetical protein
MRRVILVGVSLAPMKSVVAALKNPAYRFKRIDLEAGPAVAMALQRSRPKHSYRWSLSRRGT